MTVDERSVLFLLVFFLIVILILMKVIRDLSTEVEELKKERDTLLDKGKRIQDLISNYKE